MKTLNIDEIKDLYKGYFFSKGATNFFKSRIAQQGYQNEVTGDIYFVTSEQFNTNSRRYTVRTLNPESGSVNTVGVFQNYSTSAAATSAAKRYANRGEIKTEAIA